MIHSGNVASQLSYTASHLRFGGSVDSTWNFSGQSGQPTWVFGSNDGQNVYVWNPANWNVNYANSANYATNAGNANTAGSVGGVGDPASKSQGAQFGGGVSVASNSGLVYASQGGKFVWNDVGTGETCLVNNYGGGNGGFVFRTVNNNNTVEIGRFTITAAGSGSQGSDERLKDNIATLTDALANVRQLRGVSFSYKANGEKHYGVIAQEVQPIYPDAVVTHQGSARYAADGEEDYLGVAYSDLVAPLIEAVKTLADQLDTALARIAALEEVRS